MDTPVTEPSQPDPAQPEIPPQPEAPPRPDDHPAREEFEPKRKFLDKADSHTIVLGKLRTDEEARLAAEIEKLLG